MNSDKSEEETVTVETNAKNVSEDQSNNSTEKATNYMATSIALIEKLLLFSTPRLDTKIVNVLLIEGMMDILMTHITRLEGGEQHELVDLTKCTTLEKFKYATHKRDIKESNAMKRSYHAMEFLSGTTANHLGIQNSKFFTIVNNLFNVFLPNSHGNFNHFFRVFQHFVRRYPQDMLEYVIMANDASILFNFMLPYLKESAVMDSILGLIFVHDINLTTKEKREQCQERLHELKLLEWIFEVMQMSDYPDYVEAAQEFFLRIIEESSQVDRSNVLFKSLSKEMIGVLVDQMSNLPPSKKRKRTIKIAKLLVKSGMLNSRASSTPVQGPLFLISAKAQKLFANHLPKISSLITKDREQISNTKEYPLTTSDIDLIEIIYQILFNMSEKAQMLASIHTGFWDVLVHSFFEKSSSSIYHTLFYRILSLVLSVHDDAIILNIIDRSRLIHRLIQEYEDKTKQTDIRGYGLLILNHFRLLSDAHQSKTITQTLQSHVEFQRFLPTLRDRTMTQLEPMSSWKLDVCSRPPAHLGPSPPIHVNHFSPYAGSMPLVTNLSESDQGGIDLGSEFAYSLGFTGSTETEPLPEIEYDFSSSECPLGIESEHHGIDSDEEDLDCPLCMEELDIADRNFRPCPCGYKICRFCWHHIRENLNGRCPACRREYSEQIAEFEPISADEIQRIRREKKEKERQQKDMDIANRRHLANMRVVQKNLVYIIGLHPKLATEETVRSNDYFGQFGKIAKIVINKRQVAPTSHANGATSMQPSAAVYVTYARKDDAAKAIHAVDGSVMAGRVLRASYGTTKYCTYYLRNMSCPNPSCLYLHEPGEDADTISKEELATGKHRMRDQVSYDNNSSDEEEEEETDYPQTSQYSSPTISNSDFPPVASALRKAIHIDDERPALPATASWGKNSIPGTPTNNGSGQPGRTLTSDAFGPPLSVAVAQQQQQSQKQQVSPTVLKRKLEKKKRKELLQKQRKEEEEKELQPTRIADDEDEIEEDDEIEEEYYPLDELTQYVMGYAFEEMRIPRSVREEKPVGVSALYEASDVQPPIKVEPPASLDQMTIKEETLSPFEFLTQSIATPKYTGTFNPFSHQILRSNTALFGSPVRKHSRFGFAQF
ncbi:hypothetical protein BY458DRAFT_474320 [Sporodiniella umbellata]|nr:hypothetical protein BY458DRAFT_474320 [Sporodiniella umbellata]